MRLKYGSRRTWSQFWNCWFASKAEAKRADELWLLQMAGEISDLQRQVKFVLSEKPRVSITIDFEYMDNGQKVFEDVKGVLTRDFRTKMAWLKEKYNIDVRLMEV